jgi:aspartyl protease family protein
MRLLLSLAIALSIALLSAAAVRAAGPKIKLVAIFKDKVIANINGKRVILTKDKPGPEGVTLRFTDTRGESADLEIDGKLEILPLGYVMSGTTEVSAGLTKEIVTLRADAEGFFHADGHINGRPVKFLVDTGANTIALNSATAARVGVDFRKGEKGVAVTASGYTQTYTVTLEKVEIGGLELRSVVAGVIEGPQPEVPLLGMSFLSHFDMKREGSRMEILER